MLDLMALRCFYLTAKLGGIGAAARELKVTQPAVSQRLSTLERALGRKLHGRAGRGMVLTDEGKRLFQSCRAAFDVLDGVQAALTATAPPMLGEVRIGTISELSKAFLLPQIGRFRKRFASVTFEVDYQNTYTLLDAVMRHQVDFALSNQGYGRAHIEAVPLFKETVVIVGPKPARKLRWAELADLPWIGYGQQDSLWFEFDALCAKNKVRAPRPAMNIGEVESVLMLAAQGAGFALAPAHALKVRSIKGLTVHELPLGGFTRQIYLCRLKTVELGRAQRAFWDFCLDAAKRFRL